MPEHDHEIGQPRAGVRSDFMSSCAGAIVAAFILLTLQQSVAAQSNDATPFPPVNWRPAGTPTPLAGTTAPLDRVPRAPDGGSIKVDPLPLEKNAFRFEMPLAPSAPAAPIAAFFPEEQQLQTLREQERHLTTYFVDDHFRVREVRTQIRNLEHALAQKKSQQPAAAVTLPPTEGGMPPPQTIEVKIKVEVPEIKLPPYPEIRMPEIKLPPYPEIRMPPYPDIKVPLRPEIKLPPYPDIKMSPIVVVPPPEKEPIQHAAAVHSDARANENSGASHGSAEPARHKLADAPQLPSGAPAAPVVQVQVEHAWELTLLHVGAIAAGLFLGLALHLFVIWCLMRSLGARVAQLLRLELAAAAAPIGGHAPAPPAPAELPPALTFDLGPTYEEELNQKKKDAEQQEAAVLRELFQQNLTLREQIDQLEAVGN